MANNGQFQKGQPRHPDAGRKPGQASRVARLRQFAQDLSDSNDLPFNDPAEMLMIIAMTGRDPLEGVIDTALGDLSPYKATEKTHTRPDGSVIAKGFIPIESRIDAARLVLPYMLPRLSSIEVTNDGGNQLFKQKSELSRQLSADPHVRELFESITQKAATMNTKANKESDRIIQEEEERK